MFTNEDYNKIAVKKAKEIPAPDDAAGEGPSEAASVIGLVPTLAVAVAYPLVKGEMYSAKTLPPPKKNVIIGYITLG